jgi:hypothetical protein
MTIALSNAHIMGTGSATLVLHMGTQIFVKDALLYPDSKRNFFSFKDICANGFHVENEVEHATKYLLITKFDGYQKRVVVSHPILQGKPNASHMCARIDLHTHDGQNESNTIAVINRSRVKPVRYPLLHPESWTQRSEHNDN